MQALFLSQHNMTTSTTPSASTDGKRVIKKYPNRRLYDTETSTYVTLSQVRSLVMTHTPFVVLDAKTGEDLTRSILLQLILEAETHGGTPMFSEAMLSNIIRFYGHAMQGFMGSYLERSITSFAEMQAQLADATVQFTPDFWRQFNNPPMLQMPVSMHLLLQMQEHLARQTGHVLGALSGKHASKP